MAYGDNRSAVATDDFSTDPFSAPRWANGYADWGTLSWGGTDYLGATSTSTDSAARRSNSESFAADQYCKLTAQTYTSGEHYFGAACRMQNSSTDESCYVGYAAVGSGGDYRIEEINSSFGFTTLTSTTTQTFGTNDTLTLEVEGTTLRQGSDEGGGDTQKLTTTDNTIASGIPGIVIWSDATANCRVDAWEGGSIGGTTHTLLADDVQSTSNVTAPAIGQVHAILANDVQSTSNVTAPALAQVHALTAADVESTSEVTAPGLLEVTPLTAEDVESASEVSAPVLTQVHVLLAADVESASEVSAPTLTEGQHVLLADDVQSTSEVSAPALTQVHALTATSVQSTSSVSAPALGGLTATRTRIVRNIRPTKYVPEKSPYDSDPKLRVYIERELQAIARAMGGLADDGSLYDLVRYGADNTGATSCTAAFNDAIAACIAAGNHTLWVPHGTYTFATAPDPITQGVMIVAPGSMGANDNYGTAFIFDYDSSNGLEWNGNGAVAAGTGGGLKNILLDVGTGKTLGDMIKLLATDDNHRPGEFVLENVLAGAEGGQMTRFLHIDGTACATPGTKGVRSIRLDKVRCAKCTTDNQYIYLNQAVHVFGDHVQIDQAGGSGAPGMTIDGDWDNIFLTLEVNGAVIVEGTGGHLVLDGHISDLQLNASNTVTGAFTGSAGAALSKSSDFKIISNKAAAWRAVRSTDQSNITGTGTVATVVFDSVTFDRQGGEYDNSTGILTVEQAGVRRVHARVTWNGVTASVTQSEVRIVHKNSGGATLATATSQALPGGDYTQSLSETFFCNYGDTLRVQVMATGLGADTVGVEGSGLLSTFSGKIEA